MRSSYQPIKIELVGKEVVRILGEETNGRWSSCFLSGDEIARLVAKGPIKNLEVCSRDNSNFRKRIYQEVLIPISVFKQLAQEVITK